MIAAVRRFLLEDTGDASSTLPSPTLALIRAELVPAVHRSFSVSGFELSIIVNDKGRYHS